MADVLIGLEPADYEHPFDRQALNALRSNMLILSNVSSAIVRYGVEKIQRVQYTGSCLKVNDTHYPELMSYLNHVCCVLGLRRVPDFYIQWDYCLNAMTTGDREPLIVANSGMFDLLERGEIEYILGHEVGHILSHHVLYHMMITAAASMTGISSLMGGALQLPLYYWSRMSELTADRAGLLACQDFEATVSAMIKMAGLPKSQYKHISVVSFLDQAREFSESYSGKYDEAIKFFSIMDDTHPWLVLRASELLKWKESGEYERILTAKKGVKCSNSILDCDAIIPAGAKVCPKCGWCL